MTLCRTDAAGPRAKLDKHSWEMFRGSTTYCETDSCGPGRGAGNGGFADVSHRELGYSYLVS